MTSLTLICVQIKIIQDSERRVSSAKAEQWCQAQSAPSNIYQQNQTIPHFETSAKTAFNVDRAFHEAAKLALAREELTRKNEPVFYAPRTIDLNNTGGPSYYDTSNQTCC